jgi:penicillin-binding protein 1A
MTKRRKKKRGIVSFKGIIIAVIILVLIIFGTGMGVFFSYVKDAPEFDPVKLRASETSFVYDEDGQIIAELHGEQNRVPVNIEKVPEHLKNAFIAIEDQAFYKHRGINIRSILGAAITDIVHGGYHRGASTITQQLIKNSFLSSDKTLKRKAQEAWLAIQLERHYTKEQIFEFYLNQIYFGHASYGVESAAQTFFGKSVEELNLAESAMLAGVPKSPSLYSPYLNFENAKGRQEIVLNAMTDLGYITKEEAEKAKKEEINLVGLKNAKADYKAPFFTDYVILEVVELLQKELGLSEEQAYDKIYREGLRIYTTVDLNVQKTAENVLADPNNYPYTANDKNENPQPQAAAVVIEPQTGHIKAMVGGREHLQKLGFNRAHQAYRQPGSAFKPIVVYTGAIDMGFTAASVVDDSPVSYRAGDGKWWSPENYTRDFKGLTTIRKAIADSVNVVAVKVLDTLGVDRGIDYAQKLGIKSLVLSGDRNDRQLSIALGGITKGVTPLELASAYGTLANEGVHVEPTAVLKIIDKSGKVLIDNKPEQWSAVSSQVAYIITDMLRSVVTEGTGTRLASFPVPVAGKTGTTTDNKDVWFAGYTPNYAAVVWIGHDEPTPMKNVAGGYQPALMWKAIMTEAHKGISSSKFERPGGIVGPIPVCRDSGQLPTELCYKDQRGNRIRNEYFIKGTEPTATCSVHIEEMIDTSTGLLATPYCPEELVEPRVFIQRPEPYKASSSGKIPLDAKYEPPTSPCDVHLHGQHQDDWYDEEVGSDFEDYESQGEGNNGNNNDDDFPDNNGNDESDNHNVNLN